MTRAICFFLLFAGLAIRLPGLADPPFNFHATRQYHSAVIARGYALDGLTLSPAQRDAAALAAREGVVEPPVLEHIAAALYRLAGREDLRLARLVSVIAWIGGAAALWWLTQLLFPAGAATIAALGVFLFLPFGIPASQAFQPDALMTALVVATLAAAVQHDRRRDARSLVVVMVAALAAVSIKPMAAFFIFPVALVLASRRLGWMRGALYSAAAGITVCLPAAWWFGVVVPGMTRGRLFPQLIWTGGFWLSWARMIDVVVPWPMVAAGLAGVLLATGGRRVILAALWAGYVAFGLAFTYPIHTHNYYSLPLIPIVALSIGALADRCDTAIGSIGMRRLARWIGATVLAGSLAASLLAAGVLRRSPEARRRADDYTHIGVLTGHSQRVTALDGDYALPLNYHGYVVASNLPLSIDRAFAALGGRSLPDAEAQMASLTGDFFVATMQSELDGFGDMHRLLDERYPLLERGGSPEHWRFLVYDLRRPKLTVTPSQISFFALTSGASASAGQVALWTPPGLRWRVEPAEPLFELRPAEGTGPALIQLVAKPTAGEIDRTVDVRLSAPGGSSAAATFTVRFRSLAALPASAPMGSVDGPGSPDGALVFEDRPITFQGWALDLFDLRRVRAEITDAKGRVRTIGETHGVWKRPDVAAIIPNGHDVFNSGWVFVLQPSMLADAAYPLTIRFFSETGDGRRAEIGKRTVKR